MFNNRMLRQTIENKDQQIQHLTNSLIKQRYELEKMKAEMDHFVSLTREYRFNIMSIYNHVMINKIQGFESILSLIDPWGNKFDGKQEVKEFLREVRNRVIPLARDKQASAEELAEKIKTLGELMTALRIKEQEEKQV